MKRVLIVLMVLVMLTGAAMSGVAEGNEKSLSEMLKDYNAETADIAYNIFRALLLKSIGKEGKEQDLYAEMMHGYYMVYMAEKRLDLPLANYSLYELTGSVDDMYTLDIAKATVVLDEYELEQWKKYVNGEMSASKYMTHMVEMVGSYKNAEEQAQEDIDGAKK